MTAEQHDRLVRRFSQGWSIESIDQILQDRIDDGVCTHEERDEIIDEILSNKDVVIKKLLGYLRDDCLSSIKYLIKFSRDEGYDYPEFKSIEKSINSELKESSSLDEIKKIAVDRFKRGWAIDSIINELDHLSDGGIISFKDVENIVDEILSDEKMVMKKLLELIKKHNNYYADIEDQYAEARHLIQVCREYGHDYPEFKVIEKSLRHVRS